MRLGDIIAGLAALACTGAVAGEAASVFGRVSGSVVTVEMRDEKNGPTGSGSGVVLGKGEVVTNCHVVVEGDTVMVRDATRTYPANWTLRDPKHDLCLLWVDGLAAPAATLGSSSGLKPGDSVYAVGNPLGFGLSITEGRLATAPRLEDGSVRLLATAQISPGSSGGGLFDSNGRLLGITTAVYGTGQGFSVALAVESVGNLRRNGKPVRPSTTPLPEPDWKTELEAARVESSWGEMERIARRHLEIYPDSDYGLVRLGQALLRTGRTAAALPLFEQARRLNPDSVEAAGFEVLLHEELNDFAAAEALARDLVQRWPGNAFAHVALGNVLQYEKRWPEAAEHYARAVKIYPRGDDYWAVLCELQIRQSELEPALRSCQIALKLNPANMSAKSNLPLVLARLGRWEEARLRMEQESSGSGVETWVTVGATAFAASHLTDAEQAYRKALDLDPRSERALIGLGSVLVTSRRYPEAERVLKKALVQFPQNAALLMLMGQVQAARGDLEGAEKSLALSVQKVPEDLNAWRQLYSVREQLRDFSGMATAMEEVVHRHLNDGPSPANKPQDLVNLGRALVQLGRFERAEQVLQEALRLQPGSSAGQWYWPLSGGDKGMPSEPWSTLTGRFPLIRDWWQLSVPRVTPSLR